MLSKEQIKILRAACKDGFLRTAENTATVNYLVELGLVKTRVMPKDTLQVYITPAGLAYLDNSRSNSIRYWLPVILSTVLSVLALIVSVAALLLQLLQ